MRIAIAGGTGRIGRLTSAALDKAGHQAVPISRAAGVDAYAGTGLADALRGADALIDVTNTPAGDQQEIVDFFGTVTQNLLAAGEKAGVRHHVAAVHRGRRPRPAGTALRGQAGAGAPGRRRPGAVDASSGRPSSTTSPPWWPAGPSRTAARPSPRCSCSRSRPPTWRPRSPRSRRPRRSAPGSTSPGRRPRTSSTWPGAPSPSAGQDIRLVPTWRGIFGLDMAGEVLLPGEGARLGRTTFDDWLAAGAQ